MRRNVRTRSHQGKVLLVGVCLHLGTLWAAQTPGSGLAEVANVAPAKIAGTVVSSITDMPLAQARVSITETKNRANTRWMITTENGRFEFDRIPGGKYSLVGAKRGYMRGAYEQHEQFSTAIVTGAEFDTTKLVLRLTPMASIAGKVMDEAGEPVREGHVSLYRENKETGFGQIAPIDRGTTNDLGTFEFAPVAPGKYYVSVSAKPWYAMHPVTISEDGNENTAQAIDRSLDVAYPTTYSGGATEAGAALPIEVKGGDHAEAEIQLFPVPSLHFLIRVPDDDGRHIIFPPTLEKAVFNGGEYYLPNDFRRVGKDVYEISGVAAGTYTLRTQLPGSQPPSMFTSVIDLRNDGQELNLGAGEPRASLKLTVETSGHEPLPREFRIMLFDGHNRNWAFQEVDANGVALIENLPTGKYRMVIYSPSKAYSVLRTLSEAGKTSGDEVNMPASGTLELTAVLAARTAKIEGFIRRSGKAASGVMVVLIPKEATTQEQRFRWDQSDSDGSFTLSAVLPGEYTVAAIEDAWEFDWSKPAQFARYAEHGHKVTIPEGVGNTIQLPEAVEVQPR